MILKIIAWLIIIVGVVILGLMTINNYQNAEPYFELNGVQLSEQDYYSIKEIFGDDYLDVRVCNLDSGNCIQLRNIDNLQKVKGGTN